MKIMYLHGSVTYAAHSISCVNDEDVGLTLTTSNSPSSSTHVQFPTILVRRRRRSGRPLDRRISNVLLSLFVIIGRRVNVNVHVHSVVKEFHVPLCDLRPRHVPPAPETSPATVSGAPERHRAGLLAGKKGSGAPTGIYRPRGRCRPAFESGDCGR